MRKFIIILLLIVTDIISFKYLIYISNNKKTYQYKLDDLSIIYQVKEIKLNNINEFDLDTYFEFISFKEINNKYYFDDEYIYIINNENKYRFKYEIAKPEIIEKIVYKENDTKPNEDVIYTIDDYFYVENDYLKFTLNEDIDYIRNILINNIYTTYQTNIDYSRLNVSQLGQYSVFYVSENEKIEIIVEIS